MPVADAITATLRVIGAFEALEVDYLVGGSLASSLHGIPRATQDTDLVADLHLPHISPLHSALQHDFYVDADMIRDAVSRRATFNVVHLPTMFKVDVFVLSDDPAQQREMDRRQTFTLDDPPGRQIVVASAEDIVLMKLHWYRLGEGVSDRQWNDALGVIKVQGDNLDTTYLRNSALQMHLEDLLARALKQAREP